MIDQKHYIISTVKINPMPNATNRNDHGKKSKSTIFTFFEPDQKIFVISSRFNRPPYAKPAQVRTHASKILGKSFKLRNFWIFLMKDCDEFFENY